MNFFVLFSFMNCALGYIPVLMPLCFCSHLDANVDIFVILGFGNKGHVKKVRMYSVSFLYL